MGHKKWVLVNGLCHGARVELSWEQLRHVTNAIMHGMRNIFPPDAEDSNDQILEKKLKKGKGTYETRKTLLGFNFDSEAKTMWLESAKCQTLPTILRGWICKGKQGSLGIPFGKFESTVAKIRYTFTSIPVGRGLLSPCNQLLLLKQRPAYNYLHRNPSIRMALEGCRTLLQESTNGLTGLDQIVDASSHGVGRVVFRELSACNPVVF